MSPRIARALGLEHPRKFAVMLPGARHGLFVNGPLGRAEFRPLGDVRLRAVEPHVPLALLLGVIEGMRVQEGPHELPAHVFQAKFEVRVLIDRVMPAEVRSRADHHPLLFGDFLGTNEPRRIARARRRHCRIERVREIISQRHARRRRFHLRSLRRVGYGRKLRGHLHRIVHRAAYPRTSPPLLVSA